MFNMKSSERKYLTKNFHKSNGSAILTVPKWLNRFSCFDDILVKLSIWFNRNLHDIIKTNKKVVDGQ